MNRPFPQWALLYALFIAAAVHASPALAQADNKGPDQTARKHGSTNPMHFVLVMKSHFDIGYSALARDVEHEYRTTMIDRALETMEQNARVAGPGEQFVWTIPGWPMETILWEGQNPKRKQRIEEALRRGNLVIHALPYTIETGSADAETLARGFICSSRIARKYGLPLPRDAKMTDVPGHDWIIPTLLHHAGVKFFHLGANPTNVQLRQPRLFWWEGPDGSRVLTLFSSGYDSGLLPPADWPHSTWLAMVMSGDNEGPPSAESVRSWIASIKAKYPDARITVGRMEDFADSLLAENPDLPVVRGNVSDSWIHGLASSPNAMKTMANVRPKLFALEALRTLATAWGTQFQPISEVIASGYDNSLRWSEHTWGLANQHFVPGLHGEAFRKAYAGGLPPNYEHMVKSWKEHDSFPWRTEDTVVPKLEAELHTLAENVAVSGLRIVVFNQLPWARDGVVDFAFPFMGSIVGKAAVKPVDGGEVEALQTWGAHSHRNGRFIARGVPPLGYRTYIVTDDTPKAASLRGDADSAIIENKWLRVRFDPSRGCIASIIEKATGIEWVDSRSPQGFGQVLVPTVQPKGMRRLHQYLPFSPVSWLPRSYYREEHLRAWHCETHRVFARGDEPGGYHQRFQHHGDPCAHDHLRRNIAHGRTRRDTLRGSPGHGSPVEHHQPYGHRKSRGRLDLPAVRGE
ncbi:MAG: hypothetical protein AB9869_20440 [Verrucomicrobiia bacterium]